MDFLEGTLLGPLWSDTDYQTRRHTGFNLFISLMFWLYLFYAFYRINSSGTPFLLADNILNWTFIGSILFLISPLLCLIYYKSPLIARFAILFTQFAKYLSLYLAFFKWLAPSLEIDFSTTLTSVTVFLNDTVGTAIEYYTERYQTSGLFASTAILGIVAFIVGLVILSLCVCLPFLYFKLLRWLQAVVDDIMWICVDFSRVLVRKKKIVVPQKMISLVQHVSRVERQNASRHNKLTFKRNK